jgi:hypothetical protein
VKTECNAEQLEFQGLGTRQVVADFSAGQVTSDAGALLLREVEHGRGILTRFAQCFVDHRDPERREFSVEQLLAQRVYALGLGYEDLNDHETLRRDPLLATLVGRLDPTGADRARVRDRGCGLAGKSTLNRLELTPADAGARSRYQKIVYQSEAIENFFVDLFLDVHDPAPAEIILDLDATDDPLHGEQEGRFFHGYYACYCYLPLYIFCGDHLLCALLRPSNIDAAAGALEQIERIVARIRARWPGVKIILRADSGFAREPIMAWCEAQAVPVHYLFGLARNERLEKAIARQLEHARRKHLHHKRPWRCFHDFRYRTRKSWSRKRRVIGKAEWLDKGPNPRFVVTSLSPARLHARELYEKLYCARGDMENRIKEQQLDLFADRTSTHTLRANQLRLWLSAVAYTLLSELRRVGLAGTELARAQAGTIRRKLLKIGALIQITVRRVWVRLSSACPYAQLFRHAAGNLRTAYG